MKNSNGIKRLAWKLVEVRKMGVAIPLVIAIVYFNLQSNNFLQLENIINITAVR